jgi:Type IV pili component
MMKRLSPGFTTKAPRHQDTQPWFGAGCRKRSKPARNSLVSWCLGGENRVAPLLLALTLTACAQYPVETRDWPITVAPVAGNAQRLTVVPPDCNAASLPPPSGYVGEWHDADLNIGCATAHNLGVMVVDPRDLLVGRDPGPADGQRGAAAIQRYRLGQEKPLQREQAGTIAAVSPAPTGTGMTPPTGGAAGGP